MDFFGGRVLSENYGIGNHHNFGKNLNGFRGRWETEDEYLEWSYGWMD